VKTAQNPVDKGIALRNHARFLFTQGLYVEARTQFAGAIDAFPTNDDRSLFYRGDTYIRWAEQEIQLHANRAEAREILEKAAREFQQVQIESRRQSGIKRVTDARIRMQILVTNGT